MNARIRPLFVLLTAAVIGTGAVAVTAASGSATEPPATEPEVHVMTVDIAENGTRFVIDEAPVFPEDGMPAYGNSFLTAGYIYPEGTLDGTNGVNPDGSPEFPDQVIGEWLCRGYFIGDGAHTTEGSWVYTTQLFSFGADAESGAETVVVTGYEGAEVGVTVTGAVTGGTGEYVTAHGEAEQELLGFNNPDLPTVGIDKRVTFELRP